MTGLHGLMNDTAKMWKSIDQVDALIADLKKRLDVLEAEEITISLKDGSLKKVCIHNPVTTRNPSLLAKRAAAPKPLDPVPFDRPATRKAMADIEKIMTAALAKLGESAAKAAQAKLDTDAGKMVVVAAREIRTIDYGHSNILRKDVTAIAAILASIDWGLLLSTAKATGETLQAVAQDAATRSLESLDIASDAGVIRRVAGAAKAQADALVETLIDGTKSMLTQMLETALAVGGTAVAIAAAISASRIFSADRAATIALTETVNANGIGSLEAFKEAAAMKEWITAGDEDVDSVCLVNEAAGPIPADALFPSGHQAPGAHVNCRCVIRPVVSG